jgi:hypothetical protein
LPRHCQAAAELPYAFAHTSNADTNNFVLAIVTIGWKTFAVVPNPHYNLLMMHFEFDSCPI